MRKYQGFTKQNNAFKHQNPPCFSHIFPKIDAQRCTYLHIFAQKCLLHVCSFCVFAENSVCSNCLCRVKCCNTNNYGYNKIIP
jgi:hypothetical protein